MTSSHKKSPLVGVTVSGKRKPLVRHRSVQLPLHRVSSTDVNSAINSVNSANGRCASLGTSFTTSRNLAKVPSRGSIFSSIRDAFNLPKYGLDPKHSLETLLSFAIEPTLASYVVRGVRTVETLGRTDSVPKSQPNTQPKAHPTMETKVEPTMETKVEPTMETKVESTVEHKLKNTLENSLENTLENIGYLTVDLTLDLTLDLSLDLKMNPARHPSADRSSQKPQYYSVCTM